MLIPEMALVLPLVVMVAPPLEKEPELLVLDDDVDVLVELVIELPAAVPLLLVLLPPL